MTGASVQPTSQPGTARRGPWGHAEPPSAPGRTGASDPSLGGTWVPEQSLRLGRKWGVGVARSRTLPAAPGCSSEWAVMLGSRDWLGPPPEAAPKLRGPFYRLWEMYCHRRKGHWPALRGHEPGPPASAWGIPEARC